MPDETAPPVEEFPSLDQVQSALSEQQADPVKSAEVIRNWRNEARSQLDQHFEDPVERGRATDKLDESVTTALKQQQGQAVDAWSASRFGGDDQAAKDFFGAYQGANGDPQKIPDQYRGFANELDKISSGEPFKPTYEARNATGSIMAGPVKIGAFTTRDLSHTGETEAQVTPITPGVEQPDIASAPKIPVRVKTPTADDLKSAREQAQSALDESKGLMAEYRLPRDDDQENTPQNNPAMAVLQRKMAEQQSKLQQLSGPSGKQFLTNERIRDELKKPEYQGKIGQYAGGEEFTNGLRNAVFSVGALKARAQDVIEGGDKNLQQITAAQDAQAEAYPGSTRRTLEGGFVNEQIQAGQRMAGEMLPYMAGAGASRLAIGAGERAGIGFAAREAATQAANASGVGSAGVGMGLGASGSAYADTQRQIDDATASGDTARADELRRGRDAHAVLTGLVMGGFSKLSPIHNLRATGNSATTWARDIIGQTLEMPAMTATQSGLVDPLTVNNHPEFINQLGGAAVQGAAMAALMGGVTRIGQRLGETHASITDNQQRAKEMAVASGASDPETQANIDQIHDQQRQNADASAKNDAVQHIEQIKLTVAQVADHNAKIEAIRSAPNKESLPVEAPLPEDASKEDQHLRELRDKQAEQRSMELQLNNIEHDPSLSEMDRKTLREPILNAKVKTEVELLKLRQSLPEPHQSLEAVNAETKASEQAPSASNDENQEAKVSEVQNAQGQESGGRGQEGQDEVVVRPATAGAQGEPLPTLDNPSENQPPALSEPGQAQQPEQVAASGESPPAPSDQGSSSSANPNIREPWVNNALKLAGQGKDQRGPLGNALKALTPEERQVAAERAGVKNPTLDDHILLAREMSDAAGKSQSNTSTEESVRPQVAESPWGPGETTGIKNEVIDNERAAMGMAPLASEASKAFGPLWDEASAKLAANPQAGYERVAALQAEGSLHSDADAALLLRHKIELEHAAQLAAREINDPRTSEEDRQSAAERRAAAMKALVDVHEVLRKAGTEVGRSLNARKMLMDRNEVPTVAEMEADRRISKGRELTPDERDELNRMHGEMTDAKAEVDATEEAEAKSAAAHEITQIAKDLGSQAEPEAKPEQTEKQKNAQQKREQRKKEGDAALQRLREKGFFGRTNAILGVGEGELRDLAIYGHYVIGEGLAKIGEFTTHMVEKFGEVIRKDIPAIFKAANSMSLENDQAITKASKKAQKLAGVSPEAIVASRTADKPPEGSVEPKLARDLLEAHIRKGAEGVDDLTAKVRGSLEKIYGRDVTDREVWDAITGYGKVSKPSQDAIKKQATEYRSQMLLTRKLDAARAEEAILKTGPQRERASEKVRQLQRELNEAMRKSGYNATAEGQVRGRLDSIKQGLKNQIEDLESVIAGRQKIKPKGLAVEVDAETKALKERLASLREHLRTLPDVRAQLDAAENTRAVAAAKASRDEYNRRIREKEFDNRGKKDTKVSAELRTMRAERDLAGQNYRDAVAASDTGKAADMQRQIDAATKAVEAKEQALIDEKWTTKNPGKKLSDNPELKLLQERSAELTKALRDQKYGDGMEAFTKWYTDRLKTLKDSLAGIEQAKPKGRTVPDNAETKAMRAEIKDLERLQAEKLAPEKGLKAIEKRIEDMRQKIDQNDLSGPATKTKIETPEMKSRQQYLDLLEQIHDRMVADDGTRANEQFRKRLDVRQAKMDEQVAAGFPAKVKKASLVLDQKSRDAQVKFAKAQKEYENLKHQDWLAKRSTFRRWSDRIVHVSRELKLLNLISAGQKLGGAAIENLMSAPVANAVAQFMRVNKTLDAIRQKALYEGSFTYKSNIAGLERMAGQWRATFQKLRTGKSDIDWVHKDPHADGEMKSWIGQVHGAIKEPVRQFIYGKSMQLRTEAAAKEGVNFGTDKVAMAEASARAYEDANADIFMGDNRLTSAFRAALTSLRKSSKDTGAANTLADVMEIVFPIINVPTNLAIRTGRLSFGIPEALTRLAVAHSKGDLANAASTMTARDAELITKSLKYGVMGAGLAFYAWTHPKQFGGTYNNTGDRPRDKNDKELDPGDVVFKGTHLIAHGPIGTHMNYVADARRLYDKQMLKNPGHPISALSEAGAFMMLAPVSKLPFIDGLARYFSSYKTSGQALGEAVRQNTIGAIAEPILSRLDTRRDDETGKTVPVKRNPKNFIQELMMMSPWDRKSVPPSKHQPAPH